MGRLGGEEGGGRGMGRGRGEGRGGSEKLLTANKSCRKLYSH